MPDNYQFLSKSPLVSVEKVDTFLGIKHFLTIMILIITIILLTFIRNIPLIGLQLRPLYAVLHFPLVGNEYTLTQFCNAP